MTAAAAAGDAPETLWHALPLHYAPHLLASGALMSKERLRALGLPVRPRPSAWRRDTRLGLAGFVHLSLAPKTPLLKDKRRKGYAHVLVAFDAPAVFALLPGGVALLRYNTKAWRHRDDFLPVTGEREKAALLAAWRAGRHPSLEVLVPGALPLAGHAVALHAASAAEADWLRAFRAQAAFGLAAEPPLLVSPERFPPGPEPDLGAHHAYRRTCCSAGALLAPPDLPFD